MTDPHDTLRRALKSEYRIGPEWSPWKFPVRASEEELDAAINRVLFRAGAEANGKLTSEALAAVWDAGATAGAQFQWEYDRTHSTDALRYLDNPHRRTGLDAVRTRHRKAEWKPGGPRPVGALEHGVCAWCGVTYPCATIEALEGK